jgi:hypothetical protein
MKNLPPEMRGWYFPFNWNLERLWALDVPARMFSLADLRWHFEMPIWSVAPGMHFDLRPAEVIRNPGLHPRHDQRIEKADISYPLDLMLTPRGLTVIDGVHRLAKYEILQRDEVSARIIPEEMLALFVED